MLVSFEDIRELHYWIREVELVSVPTRVVKTTFQWAKQNLRFTRDQQ